MDTSDGTLPLQKPCQRAAGFSKDDVVGGLIVRDHPLHLS